MATKSANLYARIEPDVKEKAESILSTLGIPASSAINMFYKQIILQRGLPFEVKIPSARPVDISTLSEAEFNEELEKGYDLKQSFIYDRLLFSYSKLKRKDWITMEECSVLIETTKSAEDKTSRWFDLPIDYEFFNILWDTPT